MNFWHCVLTALANLRVNKLRSALTMLGVIIGVAAVIVMVAIVQGASARITSEFERLGSSLIIIFYQLEEKDRRASTRRVEGLTMDDLRAIEARGDLIRGYSAELPFGREITARYGDRTTQVNPNGVMPAYERLRNVTVARGRFITGEDLATWAKVCVVGDKIARELFQGEDPLGKLIDVNGLALTVVGVMQKKGRSLEGDADKSLFVPLTTVQKRLLGSELIGVIWAEPKDPKRINETMDQIWEILMQRHDNAPGFHVDSQENILNSINKVLAVFGIVLGSIAGLALLVGGIGIMNIMLVSVTERTREIGIRKAVGAKRRDILLQFLIEAATVSGIGGLIGIALGAAIAYTIGIVTQFVPGLEDPQTGARGIAVHLPVTFSLGAFLFASGVGVFFGIYPAVRASALDPIQALRHE
ncbi:MAG: ABC transporter permease [Chloroherpetonaceae bacterium]|nr:ABC transporter permease [Chthonomonadaceae bacterium]MDW8207704.1 ABC transporter permease [Chloroherpetonaceae bacterium]